MVGQSAENSKDALQAAAEAMVDAQEGGQGDDHEEGGDDHDPAIIAMRTAMRNAVGEDVVMAQALMRHNLHEGYKLRGSDDMDDETAQAAALGASLDAYDAMPQVIERIVI